MELSKEFHVYPQLKGHLIHNKGTTAIRKWKDHLFNDAMRYLYEKKIFFEMDRLK